MVTSVKSGPARAVGPLGMSRRNQIFLAFFDAPFAGSSLVVGSPGQTVGS